MTGAGTGTIRFIRPKESRSRIRVVEEEEEETVVVVVTRYTFISVGVCKYASGHSTYTSISYASLELDRRLLAANSTHKLGRGVSE